VTKADDDPEIATLPFILANAGMAMDVTPVIVLQSNGVMLAVKGFAEKDFIEGAIIIGAARVNEEALSSVNVLTY
jgi:predicted peroxiredoxin